jgi:hypothetical protein
MGVFKNGIFGSCCVKKKVHVVNPIEINIYITLFFFLNLNEIAWIVEQEVSGQMQLLQKMLEQNELSPLVLTWIIFDRRKTTDVNWEQ